TPTGAARYRQRPRVTTRCRGRLFNPVRSLLHRDSYRRGGGAAAFGDDHVLARGERPATIASERSPVDRDADVGPARLDRDGEELHRGRALGIDREARAVERIRDAKAA